jgi:hypothetical protein
MKTITKCIVALIGCYSVVASQSINISTSAISSGGGKGSGPTIGIYSAAGLPAVGQSNGGSGYFTATGGFIPQMEVFAGINSYTTDAGASGWNMISLPLRPTNYAKGVIYPNSYSAAFAYQGSYVQRDTLENGIGYWIKFFSPETTQLTGTSFVRETIAVRNGWNMIGCVSYPLAKSHIVGIPPTTVISTFYGYTPTSGYRVTDTLKPGRGYWVKMQNAGQLVLNTSSAIVPPNIHASALVSSSDKPLNEQFSSLVTTDARGQSRTVYFGTSLTSTNQNQFELPPIAPGSSLDVRYATNQMLAVSDHPKGTEVAVQISSAEYPVRIKWNNADAGGSATLFIDGKEIKMSGSGATMITSGDSRIRLKLLPTQAQELPKQFALHQNFPNPFNPLTAIHYDLPKEAHVTVKIYNALGEEVKTLADDIEEAGFRSLEWNATNNGGITVASGVYFYRIEAKGLKDAEDMFVEVKKMLLMK